MRIVSLAQLKLQRSQFDSDGTRRDRGVVNTPRKGDIMRSRATNWDTAVAVVGFKTSTSEILDRATPRVAPRALEIARQGDSHAL